MDYIRAIIDYGIIGILIIMSVVATALFFERWNYIRKVAIENYITESALEIDLTKGLHVIASIGANAPYVGLLGTVLGIMVTFYTIGQEGHVDSKKIMSGLALALKATAIGLLVAIPATVMYNTLLRKVKEKIAWYKTLREQASNE